MAAASSSAANTMAHQIPPLLPHLGARVRPPRMLPGTVSPNTDPQPQDQVVPPGKVWVQGKWRDRASNAAKHQREIRTRQVVKALRQDTHGTSIYAYRHLRTNQVVYSLSRVLQNASILKQLVFHGKKTVPRALRRDMWTPYFAVKLPQNPAMAQVGLDAFRKLREFSLQRQLAPPEYLRFATQEDVEISKKKWRSPDKYIEKVDNDELGEDLIELGKELPKRIRAIKLMNQRAASVADVAFVLELVTKNLHPLKRLEESIARRKADLAEANWRQQRRMKQLAKEEAQEVEKLQAREDRVIQGRHKDGDGLQLSWKLAEQLSIEHQTKLNRDGTLWITDELATAKENAREWEKYLADLETYNKAEKQYHHDRTMFEQKRAAHARAVERYDSASAQEISDVARPGPFTDPEPALHGLTLPEKPSWAEDTEIRVLWTDMNDGLWAKRWPANVVHGELAAFAQPKAYGHKGMTRSVHVIGADASSVAPENMNRWYPQELTRLESKVKALDGEIAESQEEVTAAKEGRNYDPETQDVIQPPKSWWGRLKDRIGF